MQYCSLVYMEGPLWIKKDKGAWSVPFTSEEEPLAAAIREFKEETGLSLITNGYFYVPI